MSKRSRESADVSAEYGEIQPYDAQAEASNYPTFTTNSMKPELL